MNILKNKDEGRADPKRVQKYIKIGGKFKNGLRSLRQGITECSCLVAPEYPKSYFGTNSWCEHDCPVQIKYRIYVNCTEEEVFDSFVDLKRTRMQRSDVFGDTEGGGNRRAREIRNYEIRRCDPVMILLG